MKRIEALGETLGEDILQELGMKLAEANQSPRQVHLQLQILARADGVLGVDALQGRMA